MTDQNKPVWEIRQTQEGIIKEAEQETDLEVYTIANPQTNEQIDNSIIPSIKECERFIKFLDKRFNLALPNDITILIHETRPSIKGFFRPKENMKRWESLEPTQARPINSIVLSSHTLTSTPYETLAHELAHYINHSKNIKDCSGSQYHNKHFKKQAEALLLGVDRVGYVGFAYTFQTPEFLEMLKEFGPDANAFKLLQKVQDQKTKVGSRLLLYMCGCGCKIRTAKNEDKPLNAVCEYCKTKFEEVQTD